MPEVHPTHSPLAGYRILDLTTFLSGPFCTQVLADLGADVVKIESPAGDSSRHIPPHFVGDDSAYFLANNRNKRSVMVDLKTDAGRNLIRKLISKVDVVVENFRPGVARRLGIDPTEMREQQPRLIWASISGFGPGSPWEKRPAYDMIVQALSGVMSLTGEKERPSVRLGIPAGDTVAGLYATIAITSALADRERTGEGRTIDVAMLDCQLAMLSYQSAYALIAGVTPGHQGAGHDSIPTYRSFIGGDGRELVVTANTEKMWQSLCRVLSEDQLLNDGRFADGKLRHHNREALWEILERAFLRDTAASWVERLIDEDVPAALIKKVPEALEDARKSERGMIRKLQSGNGEEIELVGNPIHFSGSNQPQPEYPPALGANSEEVIREWLEDAEGILRSLDEAGALRQPTNQ